MLFHLNPLRPGWLAACYSDKNVPSSCRRMLLYILPLRLFFPASSVSLRAMVRPNYYLPAGGIQITKLQLLYSLFLFTLLSFLSSTHCGDFISIISRVDLSADTINSTVDIFAQLHQVLLFSIKFVELLPVKLLLPRKQTYPTRNQNLRNFQLNTPPNSKSINAPRRSLYIQLRINLRINLPTKPHYPQEHRC